VDAVEELILTLDLLVIALVVAYVFHRFWWVAAAAATGMGTLAVAHAVEGEIWWTAALGALAAAWFWMAAEEAP
jgi:hypothetical protein